MNKSTLKEKTQFSYSKFDNLDGTHPLQKSVPESCVMYNVRTRHGGKVHFFNFKLAKEMGLIPNEHPDVLTIQLEKKILDTFALIIINEYDIENNISFIPEDIKKNKYMATRYLQLQHPSKMGKTSGDGRSIWNGQIANKGRIWDVSSCGTGGTKLSPATHIYGKYFQSGDPTISYGCGYAETEEGLASLFFSEVFNRNQLQTERVLGIIEFEKGYSVNIRAHENLLRPSHIFRYLKVNDLQNLKKIVEYYIDFQEKANLWLDVPTKKKERYEYFLEKMVYIFSSLAAKFEDEYIFCWLDWDGDNILMDGGIIDYGSVRQFGLFHHDYRYDDIQRFSTSITEQKEKLQYTIKTFAQIYDYLVKEKKRNIKNFVKHWAVKSFNQKFEECKNINILKKIGFNEEQIKFLIKNEHYKIIKFRKVFSYFERAKSKTGLENVPDGIMSNAIFCMRDLLRDLPQIYLARDEDLKASEFVEIMRSSYAIKDDLNLSTYRRKKISEFQKYYKQLIQSVSKSENGFKNCMLEVSMRSSIINRYDRVTGDSITTVVNKVFNHKPKLSYKQIYEILTEFVEYQDLRPVVKKTKGSHKNVSHAKLIQKLFSIVKNYREGI
ncbi:MAG: hypothetical protein H6622_06360 [Halobacteriovoraceae bacterium]|nr:hypothetical protein [Halobacteriovoraceae bacterium]